VGRGFTVGLVATVATTATAFTWAAFKVIRGRSISLDSFYDQAGLALAVIGGMLLLSWLVAVLLGTPHPLEAFLGLND
jgi:hypothetical protein